MHPTPTDDLTARLIGAETPADVVRASAALLAGMLDGFRWTRPRHALERRQGARREVLQLESSRWSRSGRAVGFSVGSLAVFDEDLGAWRRANPELTVDRPESVESIVCACSFLDLPGPHSAVLGRPEERRPQLEDFAARLRESALPWFAATADPEHLAHTAPDTLLTPWGFAQDLVEFLVCCGRHPQARALWERVEQCLPAHREAFATGRAMAAAGQRPHWHTPEALGWSAHVLDLL